ncbi:MAG TPA: nickel/cobalt transporter [Bordetella sp.]|nr:nickel/cobalt transporter [Bordetella sp.]
MLLPVAAWAQASHPFGVPESSAGPAGGPDWLAALFGQISAWQTHFYRQLTGAVRAWQADATAAWGLLGLSFAYGVFHALGPGHGKAVIASYVLANRQTARNGALLAVLSALLQALVAISVVAVLAWLLNATAPTMNRATRWLETASYALIVALGAWLVWQKAVRPWLRRARHAHGAAAGHAHGPAHRHGHEHDHQHDHAGGHGHDHDADLAGCGCGHAHAPAAEQVAGPLEWRKAVSAILAMGLRPCSGALIVLVFALSQGFFAAGIAAALAMGVGTGLTVAALAVVAVMAGGIATRFSARLSAAWAARLRGLIEAVAACCILLLGLLLLGGQVAGGT